MDHLERVVPLVEKPDSTSIVDTCDFLVSQAMKFSRALLHAEAALGQKEVPWHIIDRSDFDRPIEQSIVYVSNTKGGFPFRSLLARFGAFYMPEGCLYGGFTRGTLFQSQLTYGYNLFMSNDGRSDFWIRLYMWRNSEEVVTKESANDA